MYLISNSKQTHLIFLINFFLYFILTRVSTN